MQVQLGGGSGSAGAYFKAWTTPAVPTSSISTGPADAASSLVRHSREPRVLDQVDLTHRAGSELSHHGVAREDVALS